MLLGILLLGARTATALTPHKHISQYARTVWSVDAGLPAYGVTAITQSTDGYLWIGTNHGLARFDGVRFVVFDRRNTPEIGSDDISSLLCDPSGGLWIGTLGGGVVHYRDGKFNSITTQDRLAGDRIVALARTANGDIWAGGYGGLTRIRAGKVVKRYGLADGLVGDPVTAIRQEPGGGIWIATLGGLYRLRNRQLESFSLADGTNQIRDLYRLRDGTLLARSMEGKLWRLNGKDPKSWTISSIADAATVRDLLEDHDGNLWVGTEQHGLYRINGEHTEQFSEPQGLPSARVRTMFEDRDGNLWIGSPEGGLYRLRDGDFTTWGRPEGMAIDTVYPVYEDHAGDVWVGTTRGLVRIRDGDIRRYTVADGLASDDIRALNENRAHDTLWIGTAFSGLDRMRNGRISHMLTTADGLPSNRINAVLQDRNGSVWIATAGGGLARYADGKVSVYTHADGLADDFVFVLHQDTQGLLWVGTANGLSTLRDGHLTRDSNAVHVAGRVLALHEDDAGSLWMGTEGHGLYRWSKGRLTAYETVAGFPDDTIYSIFEDARHRLWFSSYRGVFFVERAQLDAVATTGRDRIHASVYGTADGLRSIEGNGGTQPAGWQGRDGRLWFPTMGGVSVVDPVTLSRRGRPLVAQVEGFVADEAAIALDGEIRLPPSTKRLEIRYTAPSVSVPQRVRFRTLLEGFDTDWNAVGRKRIVHYTNLEPGHYRFLVAAGNDDGRWSEKVAHIDFSIAPYFYQTWWFRILLTLATLALLWAAYYLRLTWLKVQNAVLRERQHIAGEIHDNLAQSLSAIFYQTEAALRRMGQDPDAAREHLRVASDLASSSADAARRSVWELVTPNPTDEGLLKSIDGAVRHQTLGRKVDLRLCSSGNVWPMPDRVQQQVLRVVQAAVANAIEHAACSEIGVELFYSEKALCILVRDNGTGFQPHEVRKESRRGFGMGNMLGRVRGIGGSIDIQTEQGVGTSVRVTVPRRRSRWRLKRWIDSAFG